MKTYKDLDEKERDIFAEEFYSNWNVEIFGKEDFEASCPWGCPWTYKEDEALLDEDIVIAASKYFDLCDRFCFLFQRNENYIFLSSIWRGGSPCL